MSQSLGLLFFALFVLTALFCIYLIVSSTRRIEEGINRWRENDKRDLEIQLRQIAESESNVQFEQWKTDYEIEIRQDAARRSFAVTRGKITEHIVPYLPGFDLNPKDIRFIGTPIDLIAFDGLNDPNSDGIEIVFIEIKTGKSALSAREKAVKAAVERRNVSWRVFNPDVDGGRAMLGGL